MEKEKIINAPKGCEIEKVEIVNGAAVVTFKEKERKLPKTWEEFCEMFPVNVEETFINLDSELINFKELHFQRKEKEDCNLLPDKATAESILALCQLIQLRNAYNGDWVPDWIDDTVKFCIHFYNGGICIGGFSDTEHILNFKTRELRDKFLRNFRPLIEKLKPLYGIKKGGEE